MRIMATSFKRFHACTAALSAHNSAAGHRRPRPPLETPGHSRASLGQSLGGSLLLSPGSWCTRFCLCPPRVCFQSCEFWRLCGGVNGDLLKEGLCPEIPQRLRQNCVCVSCGGESQQWTAAGQGRWVPQTWAWQGFRFI